MQDLIKRLAFLEKFDGVPSYDNEAAIIRAALKDDDLSEMLEDIQNIDAALDAATEAAEALTSYKGFNFPFWYIGGENASDENSGESQAQPMATLKELFKKLDMSRHNSVRFLGHVEESGNFDNFEMPVSIDFSTVGANEYDVKFSGSARWIFSNHTNIKTTDINFITNKDNADNCIDLQSSGAVRTIRGSIDASDLWLGGAQGAFLSLSPFANFTRASTIIGANIAGNVAVRDAVQNLG